MQDFIHILQYGIETPEAWGTFHVCAVAAVLVTTVLLSLIGRNAKDRTIRKICVVFWILLVLFETYKQIVFSFNYNEGSPIWDYQWYAFPFQLCSAPLYVLPLVFLTDQDGFVHRSATAFLSTYVLFAGAAVMVYPGDVFIDMLGIDIHTMFWHGSQVILGVFFLVRYRKELSVRYFLSGVFLFLIMTGVAMALNILVPRYIDETFNMYYISPLFPSTLPVLSSIWGKVPWPLFFAIYIIGYTALALLVFLVSRALAKKQMKKA